MLMKLSLDPLLDQEFEGRHRVKHVLNSEVPYVCCWIGWIAKTFDYINRVKLTLPLSVYEGMWTCSPFLVAMHLLDGSCVIVGIFFKLHATFPNNWDNEVLYKWFLTPFHDGVLNRRLVIDCDRGSFPHDPETVGDMPSWHTRLAK